MVADIIKLYGLHVIDPLFKFTTLRAFAVRCLWLCLLYAVCANWQLVHTSVKYMGCWCSLLSAVSIVVCVPGWQNNSGLWQQLVNGLSTGTCSARSLYAVGILTVTWLLESKCLDLMPLTTLLRACRARYWRCFPPVSPLVCQAMHYDKTKETVRILIYCYHAKDQSLYLLTPTLVSGDTLFNLEISSNVAHHLQNRRFWLFTLVVLQP